MDAIDQLVWDEDLSAAILGNGVEYVLISLPHTAEDATTAHAKDMCFVGLLGFSRGKKITVKLAQEIDSESLVVLSRAFLSLIVDKLNENRDPLERLYSLPDNRAVN